MTFVKGQSPAPHKETQVPWNKGIPRTVEEKKKISLAVIQALKGKPKSRGMLGKHLSEETRRKLSEIRKGKPSPLKGRKISEEHKRKIGEAGLGRKFTEEHKRKISESNMGHPGWNIGMKHSEEVKNRISEVQKKRYAKMSQEELNTITLRGTQANYLTHPTNLEKILYDYLIVKGIIFEKQKIIDNKMVVDVYIPSLNLVIEADEKYHKLKKIRERDCKKEKYLKANGISILRLTEEEIKSGEFKERLVV